MRQLDECPRCHVAVLSGANILDDEDAPPVPIRRSLLCRSRDSSRWPCPACGVALAGLTLAWAQVRVAIESCERCDLVIVDRGELDRVEEMLDESAALQTADLAHVAATTSEPTAEDVASLERPIRRFLRALRLR